MTLQSARRVLTCLAWLGALVLIGGLQRVDPSTAPVIVASVDVTRPNTDRTHLRYGHPIALTARQGRPIEVRRADRVVVDRTSLIYVEASREYKRPDTFNDAGCNAVSSLRIWLQVDAVGKVTPISPEITLTDCDWKEVEGFEPLGVLLMGGVPHVIVEIGGWESQEVGIVRVTDTDAKLLVGGRTR